jgi:PTH1 family peptidyl-tRNA hydrolase
VGAWIIAGLGNPGPVYAETRHNVGFMVVEKLAERWAIALERRNSVVRCGRGIVNGKAVVLAQPQLYMNRSGEALAQLPIGSDSSMIVVSDDLDIPADQVRIRPRGGSGGHRGLASIIERFGGNFTRVRVGIGRPVAGDPAEYVLAPLGPDELVVLRDQVERASDAIECIMEHGTDRAMSEFNGRPPSGAAER